MKIEFKAEVALIILLAVLLFIASIYYYRDWRVQQMAAQMQQTQQVLGQMRFPPTAAQALRQIGWQVQEQVPQPKEPK